MSMNKKLDNDSIQLAFEDIKMYCDNVQFDEEFSLYEEYLEEFDTIELALDELFERREMMKKINEASVHSIIEDVTYKKAKAFDIFVNKNVDAKGLKVSDSLFEYNEMYAIFMHNKITQEEFDLLKELLYNN